MTTPATIEQLARAIIAEPVPAPDRGHTKHVCWVGAAHAYLDNLADGCDDPDELIELLAKEEAADNLPDSFPACDDAGYSWHDGPHSEDEWWRDELPGYIAAVRSTYGMVSA